jgi:hypothetical protein
MAEPNQANDPFFVSAGDDLLSGMICGLPSFWSMVGNAETRFFADELESAHVDRPIYITGLPRGGTTILLEALATVPGIATHRYRDFPLVLAPVLWDRLLKHMPTAHVAAAERAHGDGIMVTPDSPEAMEEVVWMAFFDRLHASGHGHVLGAEVANPSFERFYRDHIRKILMLRGGTRYVAKGNYNLARLAYLLHLFPDARFVVPVRAPETHIASLIRQQALFTRHCAGNPRARRHLRRVGHFEFGPDRAAINTGDDALVREIEALWAGGEEVRGWALYWRSIYDHVLATLDASPALREAVHLVRFEDLCASPAETLQAIAAHCGLDDPSGALRTFAADIQAPTYYRPDFSDQNRETIRHETAATAAKLGYTQKKLNTRHNSEFRVKS